MDPSPKIDIIPIWISIAKVESSFGFDLKSKFFISFFFSLTNLQIIFDSNKLYFEILK